MEETSPYIEQLKELDEPIAAMQKSNTDRGKAIVCLFLLCCILGYGNIYQLRQPLPAPLIYSVDSQGQVVTRMLRKAHEIPDDDPGRQAAIRRLIRDWVENYQTRARDKEVTAMSANSVLRASAGPALVKLRTEMRPEDIFAHLEKQQVYADMTLDPVYLAGNSWQAQWVRTVRVRGQEKREEWTGTFQVQQNDEWVTGYDPYGIRVVDWNVKPLGR